MTTISIVCFTIFFLLIVTGIRKGSDFFSPARIFGIIWSLSIALADLKFSRLQFEWPLYGWIMLLLGLLFFLLGNYVSYVLNIGTVYNPITKIRETIQGLAIDEKKLFRLIIFSFILYSIAYFTEYILEGYLPVFTAEPDKARVMFGIFGIHLIVNGVNALIFFIFQYFILIRGNSKKKMLLGLISIVSVATFFLLLQRYNFFILFMMIIAFFYYSGRKIRLYHLSIALGLLIVLFFSVRTLRTAQFAEIYLYNLSQMKFPVSYAIFTEPYMYLVMNLENFVYAFPKIETHAMGLFSADFITAITGLKHALSEYTGLDKFPHYISGYNTFPFYWAYFYDFGVIGLTLFPFIIGFAIAETYHHLRRNPNLFTLSLYAVGFSIIMISYSSDPLTRLDMVFNYIIIIYAQRFIQKR